MPYSVSILPETVEMAIKWSIENQANFHDRSDAQYSESSDMELRRLQVGAIGEQGFSKFAQQHFEYTDETMFDLPFDYRNGSDGGTDLPEFEDGTKCDVKTCFSDDSIFAIEKSTIDSKTGDDWLIFTEIESADWRKGREPLENRRRIRVNILGAIAVKTLVNSSDVTRFYKTGETVETADGRELFEMKWKQGGYVFDKDSLPSLPIDSWDELIIEPWYETKERNQMKRLSESDGFSLLDTV